MAAKPCRLRVGSLLAPLVAVALLLPGCGYGEVSPLAYEYSKALYSVCNRRDAERLEVARQKVAASREKQEITERESQWLGEIIARAESGDWESAAGQARRLMEDQVKRP